MSGVIGFVDGLGELRELLDPAPPGRAGDAELAADLQRALSLGAELLDLGAVRAVLLAALAS